MKAATIFLLVLILGAVLLASNRVEVYRSTGGVVSIEDKPVDRAGVFRSNKGRVLVSLPDQPSAPYIYVAEYGQVLHCNRHTFFDLYLFGLQKYDAHGYPCVGAGKQETEQNVEFANGVLAFTAAGGKAPVRIRVTWTPE